MSKPENSRVMRERRTANGLCPECTGPNDSKFYRCFACRRVRAMRKAMIKNAEKWIRSEAHDNG